MKYKKRNFSWLNKRKQKISGKIFYIIQKKPIPYSFFPMTFRPLSRSFNRIMRWNNHLEQFTVCLFRFKETNTWNRKISLLYFENNRQNLSSHLELVIFGNSQNWLFLKITSSRWQEENNRLLFSVTDIDNQAHIKSIFKFYALISFRYKHIWILLEEGN